MLATLVLLLGAAIGPPATTATADTARWITPVSVPGGGKSFHAWLMLVRPPAGGADTVDVAVLTSEDGSIHLPSRDGACSGTSDGSTARSIVTWRPSLPDTTLMFCVIARGEGTTRLSARVSSAIPPVTANHTFVSSPIRIAASSVSVVSTTLLSALAGALITFMFGFFQERSKRSNDRKDKQLEHEEARRDRNLELNNQLSKLLYEELHANYEKLASYLAGSPTAMPPRIGAGASVAVLSNAELRLHLENHTSKEMVSKLSRAYDNANRYNSAVSVAEGLVAASNTAARDQAIARAHALADNLRKEFDAIAWVEITP